MFARSTVNIVGVKIDRMNVSQSISVIGDVIASNDNQKSFVIIKPYVKFFVTAYKNHKILSLLNQSDLALCDGISVQWAASFLYQKPKVKPNLYNLLYSLIFLIHRSNWINSVVSQRGAGVDATIELLKKAADTGWKVGIISGTSQDSQSILKNLQKRFVGLDLVQVWPGYFKPNSSEQDMITREVKAAKLDILFVGRGFPLQEKFMIEMKDEGLAKVLIGEGGTFDYNQLGGRVKRAPEAWRRFGLEWLWRAFTQPKKFLAVFSVWHFIFLVFRQAKKQK